MGPVITEIHLLIYESDDTSKKWLKAQGPKLGLLGLLSIGAAGGGHYAGYRSGLEDQHQQAIMKFQKESDDLKAQNKELSDKLNKDSEESPWKTVFELLSEHIPPDVEFENLLKTSSNEKTTTSASPSGSPSLIPSYPLDPCMAAWELAEREYESYKQARANSDPNRLRDATRRLGTSILWLKAHCFEVAR